jgi:hypothetical protein
VGCAEPIRGTDRTVGDFWQWAYSDVLSNRNRSILAEYVIGVILDVVDAPRMEWRPFDHEYRGFRIEVKASAYCQSWHQKKGSSIRFGIRKAIFWNPETGDLRVPRHDALTYMSLASILSATRIRRMCSISPRGSST